MKGAANCRPFDQPLAGQSKSALLFLSCQHAHMSPVIEAGAMFHLKPMLLKKQGEAMVGKKPKMRNYVAAAQNSNPPCA
jgi:hypothetical protein